MRFLHDGIILVKGWPCGILKESRALLNGSTYFQKAIDNWDNCIKNLRYVSNLTSFHGIESIYQSATRIKLKPNKSLESLSYHKKNVKQSHQSLSLTNASSPSEVLPPNHRSLFSLPSKNPKNGWCESETTTFHLQDKNVQISANIATTCNNHCQYVTRIHFQSTQVLSWSFPY